MSDANERNNASEGNFEQGKQEYPPVPDAAIVKPEDERPLKSQMRPEEVIDETEGSSEAIDNEYEDMDGDGSPDWEPAQGPGV